MTTWDAMEYRKLSQTELNVSRICLGTMTFGKQTDEYAAARMVDMSLAAGVNFLDTANIYTGGASEEILGRILGTRRKEIILASKLGGLGGGQPRGPRQSRAQVRAEIDKTLRRLRTDYLDVYYLHQPDYATPVEETLAALEELVQEGKIRYPATSNFSSWQVAEMLGIAASRNYRRAAIAQQLYNVLNRRLEPEFVPMAKSRDVSVIVYNPLAGGFLTGKHQPGQPASGTRFDGNAQYQKRYWQDADFNAVERLREISAGCGRTVIDISLSWLLHHSAADCIILGASKQDHLEENLKAAEGGPLPGKVIEALDEIWLAVGGVAVNYNR